MSKTEAMQRILNVMVSLVPPEVRPLISDKMMKEGIEKGAQALAYFGEEELSWAVDCIEHKDFPKVVARCQKLATDEGFQKLLP
jgi:hypothetical protein